MRLAAGPLLGASLGTEVAPSAASARALESTATTTEGEAIKSSDLSAPLVLRHDVLVLCDASEQAQVAANDWCRAHSVKFLSCSSRGAFGWAFADFGDGFVTHDKDGEPAKDIMVGDMVISSASGTLSSSSNDSGVNVIVSTALVSSAGPKEERARHGLETGTVVTFRAGHVALGPSSDDGVDVSVAADARSAGANDSVTSAAESPLVRQYFFVEVVDPYRFALSGTERACEWPAAVLADAGSLTCVPCKVASPVPFLPLREALHAPSFLDVDMHKTWTQWPPSLMHRAVRALDAYTVRSKRATTPTNNDAAAPPSNHSLLEPCSEWESGMPRAWEAEDAEAVLHLLLTQHASDYAADPSCPTLLSELLAIVPNTSTVNNASDNNTNVNGSIDDEWLPMGWKWDPSTAASASADTTDVTADADSIANADVSSARSALSTARLLCFTSRGEFPPLSATLGGMVAHEVLKAVMGKFMPLQQFMYLGVEEVVPMPPSSTTVAEGKGEGGDSNITNGFPWLHVATNNTLRRAFLVPWYDDPVAAALAQEQGQEAQEDDDDPSQWDPLVLCLSLPQLMRLASLKVFVVGAGAIGCELLKNMALLRVASNYGTTAKHTSLPSILNAEESPAAFGGLLTELDCNREVYTCVMSSREGLQVELAI